MRHIEHAVCFRLRNLFCAVDTLLDRNVKGRWTSVQFTESVCQAIDLRRLHSTFDFFASSEILFKVPHSALRELQLFRSHVCGGFLHLRSLQAHSHPRPQRKLFPARQTRPDIDDLQLLQESRRVRTCVVLEHKRNFNVKTAHEINENKRAAREELVPESACHAYQIDNYLQFND